MLQRLILCVSLANLQFLQSWKELLRTRGVDLPNLGDSRVQALFLGTILNVVGSVFEITTGGIGVIKSGKLVDHEI